MFQPTVEQPTVDQPRVDTSRRFELDGRLDRHPLHAIPLVVGVAFAILGIVGLIDAAGTKVDWSATATITALVVGFVGIVVTLASALRRR